MAFVRDITERFWSYVSPRKTQQRRDKEFKATVPPLPQHVKHVKQERKSTRKGLEEEMYDVTDPNSRIHDWVPSPTELTAEGAELPPSPSTTALERPYTDAEGDTVIDSLIENFNINNDGEWDANEETMVVDDGQYEEERRAHAAKAAAELARRETQGQELRAAGWTEDAIFLFQKLGMRGFEPLLPYDWFDDFKMLPTDLFTRNMDQAFIKPLSPNIGYHAYRALDELLEIGGRVRDAVLQKAPIRTAEHQIRAAVLKYSKWAMRDANLENTWEGLSLFETVSCAKHVNAHVAEARMLKKLDKLAKHWSEAFRERYAQDHADKKSSVEEFDSDLVVPTLYGMVSCHTIMAFVSYDVNTTKPLLRTIAIFDLGKEGYDVWNTLAIAIFVIHCRNRMIDLIDLVPPMEPSIESTDEDA